VNIRFISSMTSDDEDRLAPAVLVAVSSLLDQLSLAYTLRIETTGDKVFHHSHPASVEPIVPLTGSRPVEGTTV
jgi:hypothetical protein